MSTEEYTPTIGQVREQFARGARSGYGGSAEDGALRRVHAQNEFDDWLAAHDAAIRAETRAEDIRQIRWLAAARAEYDHIPEGGYHSASPSEQALYHEHSAASGIASILDGTSDGMGWLPSWRWDEWEAIRLAVPTEVQS